MTSEGGTAYAVFEVPHVEDTPEVYAGLLARLRAAEKLSGSDVEEFDPELDGVMRRNKNGAPFYRPPKHLDITRQIELARRARRQLDAENEGIIHRFWRKVVARVVSTKHQDAA